MLEKLKSFLKDDALFQGVLLIMVAITSFGLGRQSQLENRAQMETKETVLKDELGATPLVLTPAPLVPTSESNETAPTVGGSEVVASKSGSKYHLPTCSGAKSIKSENLISFASREEAEAAGYAPAANCPGLE